MSYSSEVLADSPLFYGRLGDASGTTAVDSSGNGRNGTYLNSPTLGVTGLVTGGDTAMDTGSDDSGKCVTLANASWMDTTRMSAEVWVKPKTSAPADGNGDAIISRYTSAAFNWLVWRNTSNKWAAQLNVGAGLQNLAGTASVAANGVYHLVLTYNGSVAKLYVNGAEAASLTQSGSMSTGGSPIEFGRYSQTNATTPGAILDEAAIYGTALSAARVLAHYNAGLPPVTITGAVAAALPSLTASAAGTHSSNDRSGAVAATLPSLTATVAGTVALPPVTGSTAGALPALTGSITGTHTSNDQVGVLSATLPALTGSAAGTYTPAPISGAAGATLPALAGAVDGTIGVLGPTVATLPSLTASVAGSAGTLLGSVHATLPSLTAGVAGLIPSSVIPTPVVDPTVLIIDTIGGEVDVIMPLEPTPLGMVQRPIFRRSVIVPNLKTVPGVVIDPVTGQPRIPRDVYATFPVIEEEIGVPHIIFPGRDGSHDMTFYRRNRARILSDRREEPFGDASAEVELPVITSMDDDPDGFTSPHPWTKIRANMEIVLRKSDGSITRMWAGNVFSRNVGNDGKTPFLRITALGSLRMASNAIQKPLNRQDPLDLGYLIPRTLNGVTSRRYNTMAHVTTGILSKKRGTWSDNPLGFVQDCLADAWTLSGNQWTIAKIPGTRRAYEMRLKKTTPSWTVTNGAMGVSLDLNKDGSVRNVVYGHGVNDDGGVWRNTYYFDGTDPNDGVRLPLAADPRTQKLILNDDETGLVDNPDYDETVPVYEDDVDFGQNSRTIGIRSAQQIVDRESTPSLSGRITLKTDPREGSRLFIPPGDKIKVIGYEGRDVILHIAAVERDWQTYEVTLEVSERAHDALTLAQIRSLQKEARRDPAMRPGNPNRRSRLEIDQVVPFDADSIAGIIQPRSAPGGQWSGKAYPFAGAGRIVKTHFEAGSPFAVAIFAKPISAAHLTSIVGNPLTKDNPFEPHLKVLENTYGMVACWGQKGQRMGYSPGREDSTPPGAFTGDFDEYNTWEYVSGAGVKLWVFVYPQSSTAFSGRCYPGSEL